MTLTAEAICARIADERQLDVGHQAQRLEAVQRVVRIGGVHRRERAAVARGHRLDEIERLAAAALADDDAIGPHAQGGAQKIADGDRAAPLGVGRARLEVDRVRLLQLHLRRVLDDDDALVLGNERRQRVEQRRLARAGAAGDHDVALDRARTARGTCAHDSVSAPSFEQLLDGQPLLGEAADRHADAAARGRRQDGADAAAVGEAGVEHRAIGVDAAADELRDVAHRRLERVLRREARVGELQPAAPLDVDLARRR